VPATQEPPAPVQRAAAEAETAPEEGTAGEPEPDVEALARKVYAQLRRRLQLETERSRPARS
jgi:hypothetical protein